MHNRFITKRLLDALQDRPVVFLNGARQVGKSTLVQWLAKNHHPAKYFSFDDFSTLASAKSDPVGFISGLQGNVIFDEVQLVPEVFLAIKADVDKNRQPGKFLLTGSANMMILPKLSDALVGRMEVITMFPFSMGEVLNREINIVDNLFSDEQIPEKGDNLLTTLHDKMITTGGFPEINIIKNVTRKNMWFESYLTTLIQRDVRDISQIHGLSDLPRLLQILASQTGQLLNIANLSRKTGIEQKTLKRYLILLESIFLIFQLPAWFTNIGKRLIKTPKIYFSDTGVLVHLLGSENIRKSDYFGQVLENFILNELIKQASWSKTRPKFYYYRTAGGQEIDLIMENRTGKIVAVEIKNSATLKPDTAMGIKTLRKSINNFHKGIVFYNGNSIIPMGKDVQALPMQRLG